MITLRANSRDGVGLAYVARPCTVQNSEPSELAHSCALSHPLSLYSSVCRSSIFLREVLSQRFGSQGPFRSPRFILCRFLWIQVLSLHPGHKFLEKDSDGSACARYSLWSIGSVQRSGINKSSYLGPTVEGRLCYLGEEALGT